MPSIDTITLSVLVILIASVAFGSQRVISRVGEQDMGWFIGVWLKLICRSRRTGSGDSSIPDSGDVVVVVIVVVVVAIAGAVAIIDAVIIARVKIVAAAVMTYLLSFLLRCVISPPSTNMMDKEFLFHLCRKYNIINQSGLS